MNEKTYEESGVNVSLGDICSKIAYETCKKTYKNREGRFGEPKEFEGGFSNPIRINQKIENDYLVKNSDGVGSKTLIAQRMKRHDTVAFDLIAMNVDDTVAIGAEPFVGTNSLDIKIMNLRIVKELMKGLEDACKEAKIAMVGGEIAELREQVNGYETPYIWNADILGILEREKIIDGSKISGGDSIIALRSNGIRSNGLTLARKICRDNFGTEWHKEKFNSRYIWGEILLKPSKIYCSSILDIIGRYKEKEKAKITGMAHITGGGILNLKRILKQGLGAKLDNLFKPQPEFLKLQELGPVGDKEAYKTWNMGQGFLLITPQPEDVISILKRHSIEARVSGEILEKPKIEVESKGMESGKIIF